MNDIANDRVGPMLNPPHLGGLIRENMDEVGRNVTETAARLGCERGILSRLLNGKEPAERQGVGEPSPLTPREQICDEKNSSEGKGGTRHGHS